MNRTPPGPAESSALSALLQVEYAVCYGLASGGGRLAALNGPAAALAATRAAFDVHRIRRDQLVATLVAAGSTVPQPAPAYSVSPGSSVAQTLSFLADLVASATRAFRRQLAAISTADLRRLVVTAVIDDARYSAEMLLAASQPPATATSALPGSG